MVNVQGNVELQYGDWEDRYFCRKCNIEIDIVIESVCKRCGHDMSHPNAPTREIVRPVYEKVMKEFLIFRFPKWELSHLESKSGNKIYTTS